MRKLLISSAVCALLSSAGFAQEVTVLTNATFLTMDAEFSEANAMAIKENRIIAVGSEDDVLAAAGAEPTLVDLDGKTVLPGFIDAHSHPIGGGASSSL